MKSPIGRIRSILMSRGVKIPTDIFMESRLIHGFLHDEKIKLYSLRAQVLASLGQAEGAVSSLREYEKVMFNNEEQAEKFLQDKGKMLDREARRTYSVALQPFTKR